MSFKLGHLLVNEKIITVQQLDEALKLQIIIGAKLGSCLIELGYIHDEVLASTLGSKLGVPSVGKQQLLTIPPDVIKHIPRVLAEKYRIVPFNAVNRRIHVAMADPTDHKATDELAFATGLMIMPHIAPDMLISFALERYYGVKRDTRYARVSGQLFWGAGAKNTPPATSPNVPQTALPEQRAKNLSPDDSSDTPPLGAGELLGFDFSKQFEGFASWSDPPETKPVIARYSIDQLSLDFVAAQNRNDVADVFIKYLGLEFLCGAIMILRGAELVGWKGVHNHTHIAHFNAVTIAYKESPELCSVITQSQFHLGPISTGTGNRPLIESLHGTPDQSYLIMPLSMKNKVVAVVMVYADKEILEKRLKELENLVYKASLAFEILVIKNKILAT